MPLVFKSQCDAQAEFMTVGRAGEGLSSEEKMLLAKRLVDEEVNKELFPALERLIPLMAAAEDTNALGHSLTEQQAEELLEATTEVADGIVDSVYVLYQLVNFLGLPFDAMFAAVHQSNMSKFVTGPDGQLEAIKDDGGKILKGPDFKPVNLKPYVMAAIFRSAPTMQEQAAAEAAAIPQGTMH